jgi:NADH-quinone oxidoreductase subunit F
VDLHLIPGAAASEEERRAIDAAVDSPERRGPGRRHMLLPALQAAQARVGWISPGAINHIARRLDVPPAEAYGVATFYAMLSVEPRPGRIVHVCDDIACRTRGAESLCAALSARLGPEGRPSKDGRCLWMRSPCLGQCERAPAALVQVAGSEPFEASLAPAAVESMLGAPSPPSHALVPQTDGLRLLRRVGRVDPTSLEAYRASGGTASLRRAFALGPEGVVREVVASKLVGRGGAAFPTGRKWEAVAREPARPHYFVLNADESEPGTFKDRVLMEEDPFAVIEATTIAGYATGSERGYAYVRGEYPLAAERLEQAIRRCRDAGLLGDDILGSGFSFDVELRRGAGAYICGEETALFNSIEGLRGEPRQKPPFPVQAGLFGKPTAINNVETIVNLLEILPAGGAAFASVGSGTSTGTKLFCVSGAVRRPGLYEVPFGTTLRALLDQAGTDRLRAVLLGGAAGAFVTPAELDVPLTFEGVRAVGATIGSGVVMAFDDRADLGDLLLRIAAFFRDESCGQCVPCRVGTVRQEEALRRLAAGTSSPGELGLVGEIGQAMRDASICGLGQTASSAVESALRKFRVFANHG